MDILDSLRQAPSAELYRLYLAIGKLLDDPRRILEIRQHLHLGMSVNYIGDDPLGSPAQGTIVELRQTQAVVQDSATRRRLGVLYAAIIPDTASGPDLVEPASPPRTQREEFFISDTVGFTDIDRDKKTVAMPSERTLTLTTTRRVEAERSVSGQRG